MASFKIFIFNMISAPINKNLKLKIIAFIIISFPQLAFSQGCSDAGFCTMGAMRPNQNITSRAIKLRSVELGQYLGYTKFGDLILSFIGDFNFSVNPKMSFQIKVPYNTVIARISNTHGIGDISLSATRNLYNSGNSQINFTLGTKIPTNNSNKKNDDGIPLPMYYQTSLGTFDIVAGLSYINRNWLIAVGYQEPLNSNGNQFKWGLWAGNNWESKARQYPVSYHLKRGNDIMVRIERNFRFARFNTYIGLLPIYRLNKDIITSPQTGQRVKAPGSDGLAMTALYGIGYRFSTSTAIKFLFGAKLVQRKINPDGLSREVVSTVSFEYRF